MNSWYRFEADRKKATGKIVSAALRVEDEMQTESQHVAEEESKGGEVDM